MSRRNFEAQIVQGLQAVQSSLETKHVVYTETLSFPGYDLGNGDNVIFRTDPNYRAEISVVQMYHLSEAIASSPTIKCGTNGGTLNEFFVAATGAATSVDTNVATDADSSFDFTRILLDGVTVVVPANTLVIIDGTDPGAATGIGTLVVMIKYFT